MEEKFLNAYNANDQEGMNSALEEFVVNRLNQSSAKVSSYVKGTLFSQEGPTEKGLLNVLVGG